jgi:hypothetical protein
MTYSIETVDFNGREESTPITASTDKSAIRAMRTWVSRYATEQASRGNQGQSTNAFLAFAKSDGTRGYINPNGSAAVTGKSWV